MILGKLQKVEVSVFEKKYSPVVLGKASMFAFHLMERGVRYVLQDEMVRFLHMTMDDAKWDEPNRHCRSIPHHRSEFSVSVLCKDGKIIDVEAEIVLMRRNDGEWIISMGIECDRLRFPSCKALKGFWVYFGVGANCVTGEINYGTVWLNGVSSEEFKTPQDTAVLEVRKKLFAS